MHAYWEHDSVIQLYKLVSFLRVTYSEILSYHLVHGQTYGLNKEVALSPTQCLSPINVSFGEVVVATKMKNYTIP